MLALAILIFVAITIIHHPSRNFSLWRYFAVGIIANEMVGKARPSGDH
jgi:hypothetical protein